jgi:hypothetical protein
MMDLERIAARAKLLLGMLSILGLVVFAAGATVFAINLTATKQTPRIETGAALITATLGLLAFVIMLGLRPFVDILQRRTADERARYEQMMGAVDQSRSLLEQIRDTASLSDSAKQIAFRAKDLDALRRAIREDIDKGDYEAATLLADEMERRFGYKEEADRLREAILNSSRAAIDARVRDTVDQVETMLKKHDWADAQRTCDRLLRLFPLHVEARRLPERVGAARDSHKRDLLKQWRDAVGRDDVDRSVDLLKQLDQYLSPSEAEAYKESARDVFKKRLQQLGVQFALHVHDKNWAESLRIGRQIMEEFPNTRMANEIKERLAGLTEKTTPTAGVGA